MHRSHRVKEGHPRGKDSWTRSCFHCCLKFSFVLMVCNSPSPISDPEPCQLFLSGNIRIPTRKGREDGAHQRSLKFHFRFVVQKLHETFCLGEAALLGLQNFLPAGKLAMEQRFCMPCCKAMDLDVLVSMYFCSVGGWSEIQSRGKFSFLFYRSSRHLLLVRTSKKQTTSKVVNLGKG